MSKPKLTIYKQVDKSYQELYEDYLMELKTRFQILSSRLTIKGEKVAVYEMSDKYLEDLLERYNILTYNAETKCPAV